MENNYDLNAPKIELPNATAVLVLGIISIVTCCCYGIIGLVCAIIALVLAKSAADLYVSAPGKYTEGSFKNMNAGKICAWIGLSLSVLYLLFLLWFVITFGFAAFSDPSVIYNYFGIQMPQQ
jgi:hypothetical protein